MNTTVLGLIVLIAILSLTNGRNVPLPKEEVKRPDHGDILHVEPKALATQELLQPTELELNRKVRGYNNGYYNKGSYNKGGYNKGGYYKGGSNKRGNKKGYSRGAYKKKY